MADNKLDPKEIEELKKLIRLLQKEISEIDFKKLVDSGGAAKTLLNSLRKEAQDLNEDLNNASFNFKKIVQEIKNSDEGFKSANKSFNKLSEIAEKVKIHQSGISKLSSDEIKNLQKQVAQEKQRLVEADKFLNSKTTKLNSHLKSQEQEINKLINKNNKTKEEEAQLNKLLKDYERIGNELSKTISIHKQVDAAIKDEDKSFQALDKTLKNINKDTEDENKKLAGTKGLIAGINKIPFLSGAVDTNKMLDAAKDKIAAGGSGTQALGAAFKNLGGQIKGNLLNPVTIVVFLVKQLIDAVISSDKATGDLAKQFDMTYQGALNTRRELTNIADASMDAAVTTKGLQESMVAIGSALGVNARLNKEDLVTLTKLREQAGYTNEELVAIQRVSMVNQKSAEDTSKAFLGTVARLNAQNKTAINAKQLFKDIANVSDSIKLSVGGTVEKLAEAAYKARQFGINLNQAEQIADSLLNFEESINNEIAAELITGKDLNLEKARYLALNNKTAEAAAEVLKQVKSSAEYGNMNRVAQESIAKAVGMSKDDLAKSLVDREAAAKLGAAEGQSAQDRYNELVRIHGIEKANAMLGDEALQKQFQQQSVQERFAQSLEKAKEIFVSLAEPILKIIEPLANLVTTIMPALVEVVNVLLAPIKWIADLVGAIGKGFSWVGEKISKIIGPLGVVGKIIKGLASVAILFAAYAAYASLAAIPIVGAVLGGVAAAAILAAGFGLLGSIKDGVVDTKKGPVLSGEFGSVQLDPKDKAMYGADGKIKVGTNLMGPAMTAPPSSAAAAASAVTSVAATSKNDNKEVINELKAIKTEQSKANSKPTIIENSMNGSNFGTAVAMNTYKTQ